MSTGSVATRTWNLPVVAPACKLAILVYRTLKDRLVYADPGAAAYDAQHRTHVVRRLDRKPSCSAFSWSTSRPGSSSKELFLRSHSRVGRRRAGAGGPASVSRS